jgi:hypothetical protein
MESRTPTQFVLGSLTYTGQKQNTLQFPATGYFGALILQIEGQADTTTGTLYPHPAQIANLIDKIEIYDNNAQTYQTISGAAAYYLWNWMFGNGVTADNTAMAGGANASNGTFRQEIRVPFEMEDGFMPDDTLLSSHTKDLKVKITYNSPAIAGTFFGDVTGFNLDSLTVNISYESYRLSAGHKFNSVLPPARSVREDIVTVSQTTDNLKVELPKNEQYRGIFLVGESLVNGVWVPSDAVFDYTKEFAIKSTRGNNTYQNALGRTYRNATLKRRGVSASVLNGGIVDLPLIRYGKVNQSVISDNANELFLTLPVVKQSGDTRLRVIIDTLVPQ